MNAKQKKPENTDTTLEYVKPEVIIIDLTDDESLVAMARCYQGLWNLGMCS